jgi:hypothetical protein
MSLYNALFGVNQFAPMLLGFLGVNAEDVPRFRDCYIEDGRIVVYTRMGGGNRGHWDYEDCEEGPDCPCPGCRAGYFLTSVPGYLYDSDDSFDCTYASYYYEPQPEVAELVRQLESIGGSNDPGERWQKLFADMDARKDTPQVARALEVGKPIIEAITAHFASVDTLPKGGDAKQAPCESKGSAVTPKAADAQDTPHD